MASKSKAEVAPAVPTEKELVVQRVADATLIVSDFVSSIFGGVQAKVADLRIDLEAGFAAARVRDAQLRLGEIHAEVQALADEAATATNDITFRLAVTQIAILKGSFAARYAAAVGGVPGAADAATIQKEVAKLFDSIVAEIKTRRRDANLPPAGASGEPRTLTPGPAVRELTSGQDSMAPPAASSAAAPPPSSDEVLADVEMALAGESAEPNPGPNPVPHLTADDALVELAKELAAEDAARELADTPPEPPAGEEGEAAEPPPMPVPSVGLPPADAGRGSKHKSKNGFRQFARS